MENRHVHSHSLTRPSSSPSLSSSLAQTKRQRQRYALAAQSPANTPGAQLPLAPRSLSVTQRTLYGLAQRPPQIHHPPALNKTYNLIPQLQPASAMRMNTRSSSIVRNPSPVGSDSSDMYYNDPAFDSTPVTPSRADDAHNPYDSDASAALSVDARDTTPTPQPTRAASPAAVVELSTDDYPALATPAPANATMTRGKVGKKNKGKGRAGQGNADEDIPLPAEDTQAAIAGRKRVAQANADEDDPTLAADTEAAIAASLGRPTVHDNATAGASSSRRMPESPGKRLRTNSVGDAAPAPYQTDATDTGSPFLQPIVTTASSSAAPSAAVQAAAAVNAASTAASAAVAATPASGAHATFAAAVMAPAPAAAAQAIAHRLAANAAAAPAVPDWPTADGNPPRGSYAPTPQDGFPTVVYSHALLVQGMPPGLMQLYDEVPPPKFFVVASGGNGATMQTHGLIRAAIGDFINVDPGSFHLGTPPSAEHGPSPILWLVVGLPLHLAQAILEKRALASRRITLFVIPYDMPVIGFVGTFGGFTLPNSQEGANAARSLLQSAIRANHDITEFVRTHRDAFGAQVSADQAWDIFCDSVEVVGMELLVSNTNTVAWHLYVTSPTDDHDAWTQLRRLFGRLSVMTALHGTARLQRSYRCRICPSINHPTGLCPFPRLPGWLGPTPDTIAALEEVSRQAAAKAQEHIRGYATAGSNNATPRANANRSQGPPNANKKGRKDGAKGKKGGDPKGKGKRRDHDDFF
ncbi:hypothetical protein K438DRAFT_1984750 [Mycena galopus ATCC 62051]|nr:hypothetical protein K438DRAFT_1984750 [Mycena galopus ATCC 62051]